MTKTKVAGRPVRKVKKQSKAAKLLQKVLSSQGKASELARTLGVSHQAVGYWISGANRPDPNIMLKLEELYGIPMQKWATA